MFLDKAEIVIANVDGRYHALDGLCEHAGYPLAAGQLVGLRTHLPATRLDLRRHRRLGHQSTLRPPDPQLQGKGDGRDGRGGAGRVAVRRRQASVAARRNARSARPTVAS